MGRERHKRLTSLQPDLPLPTPSSSLPRPELALDSQLSHVSGAQPGGQTCPSPGPTLRSVSTSQEWARGAGGSGQRRRALAQPHRQEVGVGGEPGVGEVGEGSSCPLPPPGRKPNLSSGLWRGEEEARGERGRHSHGPQASCHQLQTPGSRRSGPGWSGPASSLPPSPAGRGKLPSWDGFLFFEARSKVGPSWEPGKLSAMRPWEFLRGNLGLGAGRPPPGPGCRGQGSEARGESGGTGSAGASPEASATGRIQPWPPHSGSHCSSLQTGTHPHITPQSRRPGQLQPGVPRSPGAPHFYLTAPGCPLLQGIALCEQEALPRDDLAPSCCK